jgi:hypothetical protein
MSLLRCVSTAAAALLTTALFVAASAAAQQPPDPLRFFEGRTEDQGVMKVIFKQPYRTHTISTGKIEPDGSLTLVQSVQDQGAAPHQRVWHVRPAGPGHYVGAMSDAVGPVVIDKIGESYRFQLQTRDHLSVEQWLTPLPGGMSAKSSLMVRKLGITVATDDGFIRKMPGS